MKEKRISFVSSNLGELAKFPFPMCQPAYPSVRLLRSQLISHANPTDKRDHTSGPNRPPHPSHISGTRVYTRGEIRAENKH